MWDVFSWSKAEVFCVSEIYRTMRSPVFQRTVSLVFPTFASSNWTTTRLTVSIKVLSQVRKTVVIDCLVFSFNDECFDLVMWSGLCIVDFTWLQALPKLSYRAPSHGPLHLAFPLAPYFPRSWSDHLGASGLPQLVSLTLHTNNLSSLAEEVITDLPRLQSLRLEHNQLECDCRLGWILDHETLAPLARCTAPPGLASKRIVELKREELECGADLASQPAAECRAGAVGVASQCPAQCKCLHGIVDCRNRGLLTVPDTLPLDMTEMWVTQSEREHGLHSEILCNKLQIFLYYFDSNLKVCKSLLVKIQNDKPKMMHSKREPGLFILFILIIFNGFFCVLVVWSRIR